MTGCPQSGESVSCQKMACGEGLRRWRVLTRLGAVIYVVFLVAAPFDHHDLICHLKNPRHCTSCTASQLGSDPQPPAVPRASHLPEAGRAIAVHLIADDALLPFRSKGRSPPIPA